MAGEVVSSTWGLTADVFSYCRLQGERQDGTKTWMNKRRGTVILTEHDLVDFCKLLPSALQMAAVYYSLDMEVALDTCLIFSLDMPLSYYFVGTQSGRRSHL